MKILKWEYRPDKNCANYLEIEPNFHAKICHSPQPDQYMAYLIYDNVCVTTAVLSGNTEIERRIETTNIAKRYLNLIVSQVANIQDSLDEVVESLTKQLDKQNVFAVAHKDQVISKLTGRALNRPAILVNTKTYTIHDLSNESVIIARYKPILDEAATPNFQIITLDTTMPAKAVADEINRIGNDPKYCKSVCETNNA